MEVCLFMFVISCKLNVSLRFIFGRSFLWLYIVLEMIISPMSDPQCTLCTIQYTCRKHNYNQLPCFNSWNTCWTKSVVEKGMENCIHQNSTYLHSLYSFLNYSEKHKINKWQIKEHEKCTYYIFSWNADAYST